MNEHLTKLEILIDILTKKTALLQTILNISENQQLLLEQPPSDDISALFKAMSAEKQTCIDGVLESDAVFQSVFNGIADVVRQDVSCREKLIELQALIDPAMELDVRIRAQESKNRDLIKFAVKPPQQKVEVNAATRKRAVEQYRLYGKPK